MFRMGKLVLPVLASGLLVSACATHSGVPEPMYGGDAVVKSKPSAPGADRAPQPGGDDRDQYRAQASGGR